MPGSPQDRAARTASDQAAADSGNAVGQPPTPPRSLWQSGAERICRLVLIAASLPPVGWIFGRAWWVVDLLSHFPLQATCGALVAAVVLALLRRFRWVAVAVAILLVNVAPLAWLSVPVPQPACDGPAVRICAANTFIDNLDGARVVDVLRRERPDILYVSELNPAIDGALRESGLFPHAYTRVTSHSPWGAGFYSRWPIRGTKLLPTEYGCPSMIVQVEVGGQVLTAVGAHPPPPAGGRLTSFRNHSIAQAAEWIALAEGPVVLCGDLNTTPWSHTFRELVQVSGLRDARCGHGMQLTWPTHFIPYRIPIDHVLVSRDIAVRGHRISGQTGSDHFPVVVDLQLRGPERTDTAQPSDSAMR